MGTVPESSVKMMLFGGAISCSFPPRFKDVSDVREVPNNQEVFQDANRDESFIIELLELKDNVADAGSARWFLEDLAVEQASVNSLVVQEESTVPAANIPYIDENTTVNAVIGTMAISKGRQGPEASNLVRVYLANIRLRRVETDILITVYEPLAISKYTGGTKGAEFLTCEELQAMSKVKVQQQWEQGRQCQPLWQDVWQRLMSSNKCFLPSGYSTGLFLAT